MKQLDKQLSAKDFATKYKGERATTGKYTGTIVGYDIDSLGLTKIILKDAEDGYAVNILNFASGVTIMIPWEGLANCTWVHKDDLTILENAMPILQVGMVVELNTGIKKIVLPSLHSSKLALVSEEGSYTRDNLNFSLPKIVKVFEIKKGFNYYPFFGQEFLESSYDVIWTKPPPKTAEELKIEELEKTVETALTQIKELKELNNHDK